MIVFLWRSDDWEALYFDGNKVMENHSIYLIDALSKLEGETIESFEETWVDNEWDQYLMKNGRFPSVLPERVRDGQ